MSGVGLKFFRGFPAFLIIYVFLVSCTGKSVGDGMIILTESPELLRSPDYSEGTVWRYLPGARITAVNPDKPEKIIVLTEEFSSACFPEISYDGKCMLFTARKNENDSWQIWEMNLRNLKSRKITSFDENCTDPVYLPGNRMAFSRQTINDTVGNAHCIFTCRLDGSGVQQVTFSPASSFANTVLKDGRIITVNTVLNPQEADPVLQIMRPDGTKADLYYKAPAGCRLISSVSETNDRHLIFAERNAGNPGKDELISISYNRPLHTRINLTSSIDGDFLFALPVATDRFLVSYRKPGSESYGICEFDPSEKKLGRQIYSDPRYNVVDAVIAVRHDRPKNLPSEVDMHVKTGLIMCQNINVFNAELPRSFHETHKARRIEVVGVDTTYGVVDVEEDGSFYLKVIADTPFRIKTIDDNGNLISGPCSWLWLRPNERRGCVGCHEDPELVPRNLLSIAVTKDPVIIPVHIGEIKEKIVELE